MTFMNVNIDNPVKAVLRNRFIGNTLPGTLSVDGRILKFVVDKNDRKRNPFSITQKSSLYTSTLDLMEVYIRWGSTDNKGSEHRLNGNSYAMEIQFAFVKRGLDDFDDAAKRYGNVRIFSMLYRAVDSTDAKDKIFPFYSDLPKLNTLSVGKEIKTSIDMSWFPTYFTKDVFAYLGSLTNPPCSETIDWLVSNKPREITKGNLEILRKLKTFGDRGSQLVDNVRPVQAVKNHYPRFYTGK